MELAVLLLIVGLILLANKVRQQEAETFHKLFDLLLIGLNAPLFFFGVLLVFQTNELRKYVELQMDSPTAVGIFLQATAVWGVIVCFRSSRHSLERLLPIDPHSPVHTLALVLSGYFAGFFILQVSGGLESLAEDLGQVSMSAFLVQQFGFVALAFLGVGAYTRRRGTAVFQRLGLETITMRQVMESVGWILLLLVLQIAGGAIWEATRPDEVALVEQISQSLYQNFTFWHWLACHWRRCRGRNIVPGCITACVWHLVYFCAICHCACAVRVPDPSDDCSVFARAHPWLHSAATQHHNGRFGACWL